MERCGDSGLDPGGMRAGLSAQGGATPAWLPGGEIEACFCLLREPIKIVAGQVAAALGGKFRGFHSWHSITRAYSAT